MSRESGTCQSGDTVAAVVEAIERVDRSGTLVGAARPDDEAFHEGHRLEVRVLRGWVDDRRATT